ncbi:methyl-accepting chemotaxis protein [Oceanotoga sp. DSM 15011]|uniref:methyl-accepting chemotaxis protein n=1 Tax=Oceanotoga sp. DSM 15011 TaxID=2984951 RepID=UPI0021F4F7C5|nr:methyl-accepting chemotaxis protein [Oceanotoga sp. DSM 15011]UYO98825.1 methyl-accepting chemotaxis protein [Oceanotoga sp. DSM 15011]
MSIKIKNILSISIGILILFILILFSNVSFYNSKRENVETLLTSTNQLIKSNFENFFENTSESLTFFANDANVKGALSKTDEENAWMLKIFDNIVKNHTNILNAYIGLEDKRFYIKPDQKMPDGYDPTIRPWYINSLKNKGTVQISEPYEDASSKQILISLSLDVTDQSGNFIGVIAFDLRMDKLAKALTEYKKFNSQYSYLLNERGITLLHADRTKIGGDISDNDLFKKATEPMGFIEYEYEGDKKIAFYEKSDVKDWIYYTVVESKEVMQGPTSSLIINLSITVITTIAIIVFILFTSNKFITKPLHILSEKISKFGKGDLNTVFDYKTKDEIGKISNVLEEMKSNLTKTVSTILESGEQTNKSAEDLSALAVEFSTTSQELAEKVSSIRDGASNVSANVEEVSSGVEEVASSATLISQAAQELNDSASKSELSANEGSKTIDKIKEIIKEAVSESKNTEKNVNKLSSNAENVGSIVETINSITEQTNLLALNAAIEAARAGEAGKGFAVVADEIRKLAEESRKATEKIGDILNDIKNGTIDVDNSTKNVVNVIENISTSMIDLSSKFETIQTSVEEMNSGIQNLTASSQEQSASAEEMSSAMVNVTKLIEEISDQITEASEGINNQSDGSNNVSASAQELSALSEQLLEQIKFFKL